MFFKRVFQKLLRERSILGFLCPVPPWACFSVLCTTFLVLPSTSATHLFLPIHPKAYIPTEKLLFQYFQCFLSTTSTSFIAKKKKRLFCALQLLCLKACLLLPTILIGLRRDITFTYKHCLSMPINTALPLSLAHCNHIKHCYQKCCCITCICRS